MKPVNVFSSSSTTSDPETTRVKRGLVPALCLGVLFALAVSTAACSRPAPVPGTPHPFPTAVVPSISEVDTAIQLWESGGNKRYLVQVDEIMQDTEQLISVVVVESGVRAASRSFKDDQGKWLPPEPMPLDEAQKYTVEALFDRVRKDALGEGPAPMNMRVVFDKLSGYPAAVETEALPTYDEDGKVLLNREFSYILGVSVDVLIEDTVGLNKQPLLHLIRSGGPEAWCDTLRIFPDGSSIYTDDCRHILLQLQSPAASLKELEDLAAAYSRIDERKEGENVQQHLILAGTGDASPTSSAIDKSWELADRLSELLSRPVGAGVTLLYQEQDTLSGFDMNRMLAQAATLDITPPLYGALTSSDGVYLAFADGSALQWLNTRTGDTGTFMTNPAGMHYLPRAWGAGGVLIAEKQSDEGASPPELGWTSIENSSWNPLAPQIDVENCLTGLSFSPDGSQLALAGSVENAGCFPAGVTAVALQPGTARQIVAVDMLKNAGDPNRQVERVASLAWSPDGSWLAFTLEGQSLQGTDRLSQLFIVHPDGTGLTPLTDLTGGSAAAPVWDPEGRLYYALNGAESGDNGVYEYDPQSRSQVLRIPGESLVPLSVSPTGEFLALMDASGLKVWMFSFEELVPVAKNNEAGQPLFNGWLVAGGN